MPMMKTAPVGTTNITNIRRYLEDQQRQNTDDIRREYELYQQGDILLSGQQAGRLKTYLTSDARELAVDVSPDISRRNWARQMDLTREQFNHNKPVRAARARTYYHFILSPNPDDTVTLEVLRQYAQAWTHENFRQPDQMYQYAIVYHDDNAKGVMHAHVVVNVSNLATGTKLHIDNERAVRLELSAQEVGTRFGLTPLREHMQTALGARTTQPVYLDAREREVLNRNGFSWKWELRRVIAQTAARSRDFDDFRQQLNAAGFDVNRSERTGYLCYTHKNGRRVKDSRLGARFYYEALQQQFNASRDPSFDGKQYSSWELIKISRGDVPWKEEIRRAVDVVAPSVVSMGELKDKLEELYGIKMTVNRRGITYRSAQGFKVRDVSIGMRYTAEGLAQNAVMATAVPYPGFEQLMQASAAFVQYLPRQVERARVPDAQKQRTQTGKDVLYSEAVRLMKRLGVSSFKEAGTLLEERYGELREEKERLLEQKEALTRLNHLAALAERQRLDAAYLKANEETDDADTFNETLLRYERIGIYLKEQMGHEDVTAKQAEAQELYANVLAAFQQRSALLLHDMAVYQNCLLAQSVFGGTMSLNLDGQAGGGEILLPDKSEGVGEIDAPLSVESLFAASRVMQQNKVRDYFHLEQMVSGYRTRSDLLGRRIESLSARKEELASIVQDIKSYLEAVPYLSSHEALQKHPEDMELEGLTETFRAAVKRLHASGIASEDFEQQRALYKGVEQELEGLIKERQQLQQHMSGLSRAQQVCRAVADAAHKNETGVARAELGGGVEKKVADRSVLAERDFVKARADMEATDQLQAAMEKLQQKGRGKSEQAREQTRGDASTREEKAKQNDERGR